LPLLQYALTELFEKRERNLMTRAAYEAAGGVTGALARRADEIFESLTPAERVVARQLFLRLITLGEGVEDTRRRVSRAELAELAIPGVYEAEPLLAKVIDEYGRYRLLTFDHDPATRTPTVEVAHEALLREWDRLRVWLADSRADVRLQRLLATATQEWIAGDKADGFLLRGARLDQFESWFSMMTIALTQDEQAFLTASSAARQQRRAEEQTRRQRELETAKQLVETERQRAQVEQQRAQEQALAAQNLRRRAIYLGVALVVALILAVTAVVFSGQSSQNANLAATREAVAQDNFQQAEQQRLAAQALSSEDAELSALLALRSLHFGYSEEADLALLSALAQGFSEHTYQEHFSSLSDLAISPDGRFLATAGGMIS
jgi:hypothetical protein